MTAGRQTFEAGTAEPGARSFGRFTRRQFCHQRFTRIDLCRADARQRHRAAMHRRLRHLCVAEFEMHAFHW
jgi:hypothetical protein